MVVGFAFLLLAGLLVSAGISGRSLGEVVRGELGRGFGLADLKVPGISIEEAEPGAAIGATVDMGGGGGGAGTAAGGMRAVVDKCAAIGKRNGCTISSDYRPGDDGDHGGNDANRAARDISNGSAPTPQMDATAEQIGAFFGKKINAKTTVEQFFSWQGYEVDILYRTMTGGNHFNHVHVGGHKA